MAQKAVISRPGIRGLETFNVESLEAKAAGLTVERQLSHGTLVRGQQKKLAELEKRGYRVKCSQRRPHGAEESLDRLRR